MWFICLLVCLPAIVALASRYIPEANLRFSHKTHALNNVDCIQCHFDNRTNTQQEESTKIPEGWKPLRQTPAVASKPYAMQSGFEGTFGRPAEKTCLQCHYGSREQSDCALCHYETPGPTTRTRKRLDDLFVFSHEVHENFDCTKCHKGITNWKHLDGHYIQGKMKDCLECHDHIKAPQNCLMCHSPTPRPADHTRSFRERHGTPYRANPQSCYTCHETSSCMDCHSRKPRSHTLSWVRHRHGISAQTNPQRCQACHSDRWVCQRCHGH